MRKPTNYAAIKARIYVRDIVSGLVPSDALYDSVHDVIADYDVNRMTDAQWIAAAERVRELRA